MNIFNPPNVVWIRHADKQYANRKGPKDSKQHDSPLKDDCDESINFDNHFCYHLMEQLLSII